MIERQIPVTTKAGQMSTFICHPERAGPQPVVIFFMDAPGIREELRDMARRLASVGYFVVLLASATTAPGEEELSALHRRRRDGRAREDVRPRQGSLTIDLVMDDAGALIAFAGNDPAASKGPIGTVGYCAEQPIRSPAPRRVTRTG